MKRYFLSIVVMLCVAAASSAAFAEKRVALVIGNNSYSSLPNLNNAKKDAKDMARKLKQLGFEVILKTDAGRKDMYRAIDDFSSRLSGGDTALVFYAGHGVQADGKNYLIPANADVETEADLESEALTSTRFLRAMNDAGVELSMMILDACRDNPLPKRKRSAARGLAVVAVPQGASGTVVLYSAGPGQTAEDGDRGKNGVFTGELLKALNKPGLTIEQVFKETAKGVARKTNKRQKPWMNASLTGDFYFKKGKARPIASGYTAPAAGSGQSAEMMFWSSIQDSNDADMFEEYLNQYPDGRFSGLARLKVKKLSGPSFQVASLDTKMYAQKTSNVRSSPNAKASKVTSLKIASSVDVTGKTKVSGSTWYRIALAGGSEGYVFGALLGDKPIQQPSIPAARQPTPPSNARRTGGGTNANETFKDCSDCPEMVILPSGSFQMGGSKTDEKPVHRVNINYSFAVGKYEVTQAQWRSVMGNNPSKFSGDNNPVEKVTWNDTKDFIRKLNAKTGKTYRLLNESEWEYAARAGTTTKYSWGDSIGNNNANCNSCGSRWDNSKISPVGSFSPNGFGLYDMHGNVYEWVEDCYFDSYSNASNNGTPVPTISCPYRVLRGGSWDRGPRNLHSAHRNFGLPDYRSFNFGFRIGRTL